MWCERDCARALTVSYHLTALMLWDRRASTLAVCRTGVNSLWTPPRMHSNRTCNGHISATANHHRAERPM